MDECLVLLYDWHRSYRFLLLNKAASFLQAFFQNGGFEINGKFFDNHLNDETKAKRNRDALERIAMYCRRVVDTLDKLNCSDDMLPMRHEGIISNGWLDID